MLLTVRLSRTQWTAMRKDFLGIVGAAMLTNIATRLGAS